MFVFVCVCVVVGCGLCVVCVVCVVCMLCMLCDWSVVWGVSWYVLWVCVCIVLCCVQKIYGWILVMISFISTIDCKVIGSKFRKLTVAYW